MVPLQVAAGPEYMIRVLPFCVGAYALSFRAAFGMLPLNCDAGADRLGERACMLPARSKTTLPPSFCVEAAHATCSRRSLDNRTMTVEAGLVILLFLPVAYVKRPLK